MVGPALGRLADGAAVVLDVGGYDGSVPSSVPGVVDGSLVLLDVDAGGLAAACGRGLRVVSGSATAIPLASGSVDVALCLDVLPCLEPAEATQAYAEIGRVLRPGGHVLVTEVDDRYRLPFADDAKVFESWGVRGRGLPYGRLVDLLAANGMRVVEHRPFYGVLTRTAYSVLFVHCWPRRGSRAKHRLWALLAALERRWCVRPRANFVVATTGGVAAPRPR